MNRVIFLDIDGVLNNRKSGSLLFECEPSKYRLDENNLSNLRYIIDNVANSWIVLSTSWRNYPEDHVFYNYKGWGYTSLLPELCERFHKYIIGSARHIDGRNKFGDICEYLNNNPKVNIVDFVVLDDDPMQGLEGFGEQFFKTTKEQGLSKKIAENIVEYFNSYKFL
jgi:hypothetical protein